MEGSKPEILLEKVPLPVPSVVREFVMVGPDVVAQQTPLAVTFPPPSEVIFPPDFAVVEVIEVTTVVETVERDTEVVENERSFPYAVPALLVAYART